jgi:hypothetical protein
MTATSPPEVHRATAELAALAVAVRPDWDGRDVSGAIAAAALDGQTWEQVLVSLPRLMADPQASPRGLVPDSRSPLRRGPGVPPERNHALAAGVRAEMERGLSGLRKDGTEGSGT